MVVRKKIFFRHRKFENNRSFYKETQVVLTLLFYWSYKGDEIRTVKYLPGFLIPVLVTVFAKQGYVHVGWSKSLLPFFNQ